jgi:hypothetical protein
MPHPTVSYAEAQALQPLIEWKRPEVLSSILAAAAEVLQANGHIDLCCRSEDDDTEVWTPDLRGRAREEARALTQAAMEATERLTRLWKLDCGASHAAFRALQMCHLGNGRIAMEDLARLDKNNRKAALTLITYGLKFGSESLPISESLRTALLNEQIRVSEIRGFKR